MNLQVRAVDTIRVRKGSLSMGQAGDAVLVGVRQILQNVAIRCCEDRCIFCCVFDDDRSMKEKILKQIVVPLHYTLPVSICMRFAYFTKQLAS